MHLLMCLIKHTKLSIWYYLYLRFPVSPKVFIIQGMILLILDIPSEWSTILYQCFSAAFIMSRYITNHVNELFSIHILDFSSFYMEIILWKF